METLTDYYSFDRDTGPDANVIRADQGRQS